MFIVDTGSSGGREGYATPREQVCRRYVSSNPEFPTSMHPFGILTNKIYGHTHLILILPLTTYVCTCRLCHGSTDQMILVPHAPERGMDGGTNAKNPKITSNGKSKPKGRTKNGTKARNQE